jgi:hypothetical protein
VPDLSLNRLLQSEQLNDLYPREVRNFRLETDFD